LFKEKRSYFFILIFVLPIGNSLFPIIALMILSFFSFNTKASAATMTNSSCMKFYSNRYAKEQVGNLIQEKFVIDMTSSTSETISLDVPKGTGSVHINILGSDKQIYLIKSLSDPDGYELVMENMQKISTPSKEYQQSLQKLLGNSPDAMAAFLSPVRSIPGFFNGFASLALTSEISGGFKIKPGRYTFKIAALIEDKFKDHSVSIRVTYKPQMPKRAPAILPLRILFSGAREWNEKHSEFHEVITRVNRILEPANVKVVIDETAEIADNLIVDSDRQILSLFGKNHQTKRPVLNVFLAKETYLESYGRVYGFSPGIPGPLTESNFKNFGVILGIGETFTQPPHELAIVLTHEILHYLGLSHTYEINSTIHDLYTDTNSNEGSSNIMDPIPSRVLEYPELSKMQANELRHHPLVILSK